jgi:hypothetical protein
VARSGLLAAHVPINLGPLANSRKMGQQVPANSSFLAAGANNGVPNESYVLDLLDAHNAYQRPGLLVAPEHNTRID